MKTKRRIKLLTYGMASLHESRKNAKFPSDWKNQCWTYSEKPEAVFWEIRGRVFCSYIEDGIPRIDEICAKKKRFGSCYKVVHLDIEEMVFSVDSSNEYPDTAEGLEKAEKDFRNSRLTGRFLTKSENI